MARVAIIGTGLIGASIGLRLKASRPTRDLEVAGFDRDPQVSRAAARVGAIDVDARSLEEAVRGASLVVLSTPVLALRALMDEIAPALAEDAVVTDTGSTKADVMAWARAALPERVHFVGGHPMAGKTDTGPEAAEATLFEGARWVIVPSTRAPESAVATVRAFVESMGAREMFMDAEEHDAYVAAISHLPMMAANALFSLMRHSEAWPELAQLAASGFRDTTRLAGTDPDMAFDIAATNRAQIVHWLERYREALGDLQRRIADVGAEQDLYKALQQSSWDYSAFLQGEVGRKEIDEGPELPRLDFSSLLMGEAAAEKLRQITRRSEERLAELEGRRRPPGRDD